VALLFIAPLGGRAQACGFPAGVAPPGSYTITCENCSVTGFTLACDCLTLLQTLQRTSIDIADCRSQPANINGSLFCDHCSAQGACCFEDASCSEGSFATCEGVGDYRGDNSTCGQVLCLSATSVTWANPDGGAFDEGGNWAGGAAPGASDIGVFDLSGTYTVTLRDAPTIRAARVRMSRLTLSGDQLQLAGASTSALRVGDAAELSLAGTTVTAPRVAVGDTGAERAIVRVQPGAQLTATQALAVGGLAAATVEILGGGVTTGDLTVGGPEDGGGPALLGSAPTGAAATGGPRAVDDPEGLGPILRVTRSGASSGTLQASQVTFGPGGLGEAVVEAGARANVSGATTIGTGGKGLLRVRGPQSLWESGGSLVVGDDGDGTLTVYTGGRVKAADMTLGARAGGEGVAEVVGTSAISKLESTNALVVGGEGLGTLNVSEFGEVTANDLFVGTGVGGEGAVTVGASGKIVVGRLSLGAFEPSGGRGTLRIEGSGRVETGSTTVGSGVVAPSTIEVAGSLDAQTFNLLDSGTVEVQGGGTIESQFAYVQGLLSVTGGGWLIASVNLFVQEGGVLEIRGLDSLVESDNPFIDGVQRPGTVRVNAGTWQVDGNLAIGFGDDPPTRAGGSLILANEGTVEVGGALFCSTRCTIGGSGIVRIGTTEIDPRGRTLTNLGAIGPGNSPGTLRIEDNLELGASSRLVMEVAGAGTGQTDVLDVAGDLTLGGTLELRFIDGYAPRAGDVFPVLRVGGEVASAFSAVNVTGLEPGFELSLDVTDGGLEVTMQSDATPTTCTDPADGDGDGVADCADNCPETANAPEGGAAQADVDADGRGDACDPCFAGIAITKPILALKGGKLAVKGAVPLPDAPSLDPAATGVRLVVEDGAGRVVVDAAAPAGAFDRATKRGWKKLKYKGAKGDVVTSARLTQSPKKAPLIGFQVAAALAGVDPAALKQPLRATFVFDASAAEGTRCGEVRFTGPPGLSPLCKTRNGRVVCRSVKR
jgi:T5SS/PEP-CTERM-associated repeat protein